MPSSDEIKSESNSISEFCKGKNVYEIPLYQREYEWTSEHLDTFWTDLTSHVNEPDSESYFFGTVILVKENDASPRFSIVDGQQRLTTSIIFITFLRDFMDEKIQNIQKEIEILDALESKTDSQKEELEDLNENKFEYKSDLKKLELMLWTSEKNDKKQSKNRLALNLYNEKFFKEDILIKKTFSEKYVNLCEKTKIQKKDELLRDCYNFFYTKITDIEQKEKNPIRRIRELWESFIDDFILNEITINDLDHAFKIFENINSKGKRLGTNNLVKNKLYEIIASKYKNDRDKQIEILSKVNGNWQEMVLTIEEAKNKHAKEDKFLKHYLTAFVAPTTSTQVYKQVKKNYGDPESANNFIAQLAKTSSTYADIISPNKEDWYNDEDIVDDLKSIKSISDGALYPIILLCREFNFEKKEMKSIIKFLMKFFFRVKTVCSVNYSYLEPLVNDVCTYIRENKNSSDVKIIMDTMTVDWKQYPEDDEFMIRFKRKDFDNTTAKYALKEIHYYQTGSKETSTTKVKDNADVEHILPQNINHWKDVITAAIVKNKKEEAVKTQQKNNPEFKLADIEVMVGKQKFFVSTPEIDEYKSQHYKKLGNLTLLNTFKNKEILNFSFSRKKEKYKTDNLDMTKKLDEYGQWDGEAIIKRLNDFTDDALKIWDLKNNKK